MSANPIHLSPPPRFVPNVARPSTGAASQMLETEWQKAVVLWLRWNDAYEQINERIYAEGEDPQTIEMLFAQLDVLRKEAVTASRSLLGPHE